MGQFIHRFNKFIEADKVYLAWASNDIDTMLAAIDIKSNPLDRHYLLLNIVNLSYSKREIEYYKEIAIKTAELHISEIKPILDYFNKYEHCIPSIPTFQQYATILTEIGEYDKAINICKKALELGLHDGTQGNYDGRIKRIEKKRDNALK